MKTLALILLSAAAALCQAVPAPPAPTPGLTTPTALGTSATVLAAMPLPTYIAAGGAYNQFAGANAWVSGIYPISNPAGILMSTTVDIFPIKTTAAGKTGYVFTTSARAGVHRFLYRSGKNEILIGADAGYSWAQAVAGTSAASGVSAAVTATYVHHFNATWGAMFPVRMLYMPGGWNPILEGGIVWTPGAVK